MLRELGLAGAAPMRGGGDDLGGEAQPAGNLQRQAAAGRAVDQPVGRCERVRVEAERGAGDPARRGAVGLEHVVVGGRDDVRASFAEVLDHRASQGPALRRIGAGADLVEQNQPREGQPAIHRHDVAQMSREGAQVGGDRLLVADVREDGSEDRDHGAGGGRDVQSGLRHEGEQPGRLQRDGLPAGVRAGDDQGAVARSEDDVDGNRFGRSFRRRGRLQPARHRPHQQRMPGRPQLEGLVGRELRLHAADRGRERRARLHDVEIRRDREGPAQVGRAPPEGRRQPQQHAADLVLLVLLQGDDLVVDVDGAERLEEQAGAARRAPVHDARDGRAMLRSDDQHEPPVAIGDHPVLQVLGGLPVPQERFEIPAQPVALLVEAAANRLQLRAGIVVDVAGGVDLPVNVLALPFPGGAAVHDRRQRRIRPAPGIANRLTRPFDRLEKAGQLPQIDRGEGLRLDGEPRQDSREVAGRFEGDALVVGGEKPDPFGSVGERGPDFAPVGERPQLREPAGSQGCQGMAGDHLDHAVELEGPLGSCVHRCNGAGSQRTLARLGLPSDPGRDARKVRSGSLKKERISRRRRRAQPGVLSNEK